MAVSEQRAEVKRLSDYDLLKELWFAIECLDSTDTATLTWLEALCAEKAERNES